MTRPNLDEEDIWSALLQSDEEVSSDPASEQENHDSDYDIQSDTEEAYVDEEQAEEPKGGVDTLDQMCSLMSSSRKTNRWPMALFYGMINVACINAYIIYHHNVVTKGEKPLSRKHFMKSLSTALTSPFKTKRLEVPTLKRYLRDNIADTLPNVSSSSTEDNTEPPEPKKRIYCTYCPSKIRRKANASCKRCKKIICREHNVDVCQSCI